jgi:hypothetical protein
MRADSQNDTTTRKSPAKIAISYIFRIIYNHIGSIWNDLHEEVVDALSFNCFKNRSFILSNATLHRNYVDLILYPCLFICTSCLQICIIFPFAYHVCIFMFLTDYIRELINTYIPTNTIQILRAPLPYFNDVQVCGNFIVGDLSWPTAARVNRSRGIVVVVWKGAK